MGCFSIQCGVTNTLINWGDEMVSIMYSPTGNDIYSLPYVGKYDDYGSVEEIVENTNLELSALVLRKYAGQLVDGFSKEALGSITGSGKSEFDVQNDTDVIKLFECFIWEGAAAIPSPLSKFNICDWIDRENEYHPRIDYSHKAFATKHDFNRPQRIQTFRMHKYAYDRIIELCPYSEYLRDDDILEDAIKQMVETVRTQMAVRDEIYGQEVAGLRDIRIAQILEDGYGEAGEQLPTIINMIFNMRYYHGQQLSSELRHFCTESLCKAVQKYLDGESDSKLQEIVALARSNIEIVCFVLGMRMQNIVMHEPTIHTSSQHNEPDVIANKILYLRTVLKKQEELLGEYFGTELDWDSEHLVEREEKYGMAGKTHSGKCSEEFINLIKEVEKRNVSES